MMTLWRVDYVVGNSYRYKLVWAMNAKSAIKKARVKNIVDLYEYKQEDKKEVK